MPRRTRPTLALAALLAAAGATTLAAAQPAPTGVAAGAAAGLPRAVPTIAASSTASDAREPDQAEIVLGVQATGATSAAAMDALNRRMDAVIAAVKATNLPGLTAQTQQLNLYPQFEQPPLLPADPRGGEAQRPQEPRITGYVATNTVRVTVGDVRRAGAVVDAGVNAGANQLMGVSFSLRDDLEARRAAIRKATLEARAKAEAMAEALGVRLGRVASATTGAVEARPFRFSGREMMAMSAKADIAPTPVEGGQVEVTAEVTVEYEIIQGG